MSYRTTSLKSRVRYEGRAFTSDRRSDLEVLPDPVWHTAGQVLRQNFHKIVRGNKGVATTPAGR